uniref:Uncharacterized protein n=1 Tax=Elaeophora elaphi TaxID=1147741 RepID=A0A0R3RMS8_9BILA
MDFLEKRANLEYLAVPVFQEMMRHIVHVHHALLCSSVVSLSNKNF